jgi:putative ABC transport system permease protein
MIPVSYNMRNLVVRKVTTAATAFGIGLVVFVVASVFMLSNGIDKMLGDTGKAENAIVMSKGADAELQSTVEKDRAGLVLEKPEVARDAQGKPVGVSEMVMVLTMDRSNGNGVGNVTIRGVEPAALTFRPEIEITEGRMAKPGTDEVIVGEQLIGGFKGLALGQPVELRKGRPVTVVGVFSADNGVYESEVWGDLEVVRAIFNRHGVSSSVRVRLSSPDAFAAFEAGIEQDKQLGLEVMRETDYYEKQSNGMKVFILAIGIVVAVFFSVGAGIGAAITMYSSVANRKREIGTLRALGFSRFGILFSFTLESVVLAVLGGVLGVIASFAMTGVSFSMTNFVTFSEVVFRFEPNGFMVFMALLFAVVIGFFGGLLPAWRAAFTSPIEAMRG